MANQRKQAPFRFWFPYWNQPASSTRPIPSTARRASPPTPSQTSNQPQTTPTRPLLSSSPSSSSSSSSSSSPSPSRKQVKEQPSPRGQQQPSPRKSSHPSKPSPTESPRRAPSPRTSISPSPSRDIHKLQPAAPQETSKAQSKATQTESTTQGQSPRIAESTSPSRDVPDRQKEATLESSQITSPPTPSTFKIESSKQPAQIHPLTSDLDIELKESLHDKIQPSPQLPNQPIIQNPLGDKPKPTEIGKESTTESHSITADPVREVTATEMSKFQEKPKESKEQAITDTQPNENIKVTHLPKEVEQISIQPSYSQPVHKKTETTLEPTRNLETSKPEPEVKEQIESIRNEMPTPHITKSAQENEDRSVQDHNQPEKPKSNLTMNPKGQTEVKLSIQKPDKPQPEPPSTETKPKSYSNQDHKSSSNGNGKTMISTTPKASGHGERMNFQEDIKKSVSKLLQKLNVGHSQNLETDHSASIITLAGQNNGATLHIGHQASKKEGSTDVKQGRMLNDDQTKNQNGKNELTEKSHHKSNMNPAITASVNSNVQSINNSLFHQSSCSQEDPGVHLNFYGKSPKTVELQGGTKTMNTAERDVSRVPAAN